jgi:hypothetical protein
VRIREEKQKNEVADEFSALLAVTRPIVAALLNSVAAEQLEPHGGSHGIKLKHLGRVKSRSDGDLGVAFEYAIHQAIEDRQPDVLERVSDALALCNIGNVTPASILFAMEKDGSKQLIDTHRDLITADSRVLSGERGQPVKLLKHMNQLAAAFRRKGTHPALPRSISGLWKADLFLGSPEREHWVGTSIKIAPGRLEAARGLRVAVVPAGSTGSDAVRKDEHRRLIICPVLHDYSFMQIFHEGMRVVQALMASDFKPIDRDVLPSPIEREVAGVWAERRNLTVGRAIEVLGTFAQPHLLETATEDVSSEAFDDSAESATRLIVGPIPRPI